MYHDIRCYICNIDFSSSRDLSITELLVSGAGLDREKRQLGR